MAEIMVENYKEGTLFGSGTLKDPYEVGSGITKDALELFVSKLKDLKKGSIFLNRDRATFEFSKETDASHADGSDGLVLHETSEALKVKIVGVGYEGRKDLKTFDVRLLEHPGTYRAIAITIETLDGLVSKTFSK